jgi:hypothetical protein
MTAQDLIDILMEGDTSRTIQFYRNEGGLNDDQHQDIDPNDIDDSMSDVIEINIPA